MAAGLLALAAQAEEKVAATRPAGSICYIRLHAKGSAFPASFERLDADGRLVASFGIDRVPSMLRPAPSGAALAWDPQGLFEIDAGGGIGWELPADRLAEIDIATVRSADVLPNGHLLVLGRMKREQPYGQPIEFVIAEIDREGRLVRRKKEIAKPTSKLRAVGNDRFLWISGDRIVETDWDGQETLSVSLDGNAQCGDALKLPSGNILFVADTTAVKRAEGKAGKAGKTGMVGEIDPATGKLLWSGFYDNFHCPLGVQALPGGNVLVRRGG